MRRLRHAAERRLRVAHQRLDAAQRLGGLPREPVDRSRDVEARSLHGQRGAADAVDRLVDVREPLVEVAREVAHRGDRAHQLLAVVGIEQVLDVPERRLAGDREPAQRPGDLVEIGGAFRDDRIALARGHLDQLRTRRARRDQVDAGQPGDQVAGDHRLRVQAHRRLPVDAHGDVDPVDVVARDRVLLHAPDLHPAHVDVAAQLQAIERLALEVDRVVVVAAAAAGVREPYVARRYRDDQGQHDRADQRVPGLRLHRSIPPLQAFYGPRSRRVSTDRPRR